MAVELQGHEESAVIEITGRINESGHLFWTEHSRRQPLGTFRERDELGKKWRRNVLMNKKRNADACCATVAAVNFFVRNR
jgi:hypothetical protein